MRPSSQEGTLRFPRENKADGVGFEPTNDFRRCRFSSPGDVSRDCRREHSGKQGPNALESLFSAARPHSVASVEPRHTPPLRATPRTASRQVADKACLARQAMTRNGDFRASRHRRESMPPLVARIRSPTALGCRPPAPEAWQPCAVASATPQRPYRAGLSVDQPLI